MVLILILPQLFSVTSNLSLPFLIYSKANATSLFHSSTLSISHSILQPFCSLVLVTAPSIHIFLFGATFNS